MLNLKEIRVNFGKRISYLIFVFLDFFSFLSTPSGCVVGGGFVQIVFICLEGSGVFVIVTDLVEMDQTIYIIPYSSNIKQYFKLAM